MKQMTPSFQGALGCEMRMSDSQLLIRIGKVQSYSFIIWWHKAYAILLL